MFSKNRWLALLIPLVMLTSIYWIMGLYAPTKYPMAGSAIMLIAGVTGLNQLYKSIIGVGAKTFILIQYFLAVEWLGLVSWLTPYGFGLESLSYRIKQLADVYSFEYGLNVFSLLLSFFLLFTSGISFVLARIKNVTALERMHAQHVKLKMAEARSGQEVLFLVHDLKTPLTSIQGLNSLINMRVDDEKIRTYSQKIEQSIASMSEMISDILFEDIRKMVSVQEILDTVASERLSGSPDLLTIQAVGPMPYIYVNKTRIVRALINLLNNAFDAIAETSIGSVRLLVTSTAGGVHFSVIDNGTGISEEHLHSVWNIGFSTKDSAGAGLAFVRQVVEAHQGRVEVRSKKGEFTIVTVVLPKGEERYAEAANRR